MFQDFWVPLGPSRYQWGKGMFQDPFGSFLALHVSMGNTDMFQDLLGPFGSLLGPSRYQWGKLICLRTLLGPFGPLQVSVGKADNIFEDPFGSLWVPPGISGESWYV